MWPIPGRCGSGQKCSNTCARSRRSKQPSPRCCPTCRGARSLGKCGGHRLRGPPARGMVLARSLTVARAGTRRPRPGERPRARGVRSASCPRTCRGKSRTARRSSAKRRPCLAGLGVGICQPTPLSHLRWRHPAALHAHAHPSAMAAPAPPSRALAAAGTVSRSADYLPVGAKPSPESRRPSRRARPFVADWRVAAKGQSH
jgi:hypothetical protein